MGSRGRHADKTYELEGVATIGGGDLAEALTDALGRTVEYRTDLTTLLPAAPRPVRDLIIKAVRAGGYQSKPVTATA